MASSQAVDFVPKKWPKQARSRASFDAILDATARLLKGRGYEAVTTNHIAEQAGVGIATLYEFFPNKESIIAELTRRLMGQVEAQSERAFHEAASLDPWSGVVHMTMRSVEVIVAEREVYRVLLRQIPFVQHLPVIIETRARMAGLAQRVRIRAGAAINLPMPEQDAWLIAQMLYNAILEIAFLHVDDDTRHQLTRELARLVYRMAVGSDPTEQQVTLQQASR